MEEDSNFDANNIKRVSVIGAGLMGHGIAEVALLSGYEVSLVDIEESAVCKGRTLIDSSLRKFVEKAVITEGMYKQLLNNLKTSTSLEESVKDADFCIEAIPEQIKLKKKVFKKLDILSPRNALLASNTSTLSITHIANFTNRPELVVGVHFSTPPVLAEVVEIIRGEKTSERTVLRALDFVKAGNRIPIISKDSPGFICNRIMAPSMLLVQLMLDNNEYTPESIDAVALNKKMVMGPYELLDYIGLDVVYDSSKSLADNLSPDYSPTKTVSRLVQENKLGRKTGEGIYKWRSGGKRPIIDLSYPANYDIMNLMRVQINEAVKVFEEEVATIQDIDIGMTKFYHNPSGPFELVKQMNLSDLTSFLDNLSVKYDKEIFRAHEWIRDNSLLKRIGNE